MVVEGLRIHRVSGGVVVSSTVTSDGFYGFPKTSGISQRVNVLEAIANSVVDLFLDLEA